MGTVVPKLILVAEDEPDMADLIADRLRRRGYTSLVAHNGRAALNAVFARKPALVILDRMMPQMEGLEVCRLIKATFKRFWIACMPSNTRPFAPTAATPAFCKSAISPAALSSTAAKLQ